MSRESVGKYIELLNKDKEFRKKIISTSCEEEKMRIIESYGIQFSTHELAEMVKECHHFLSNVNFYWVNSASAECGNCV